MVLTGLHVDRSRITRSYLMTEEILQMDHACETNLAAKSTLRQNSERTQITESTVISQEIRRNFLNEIPFPLAVTVAFIEQFASPTPKQNQDRYKENTVIVVLNDILVISVLIFR